ncbi:hypothetical protein [Arthrobacter sp. A5]|uniref:hypothetical protein n=1 Tax=Arthrobacter sp. A5 TaxID=576926 RepID=UPI003DA7E7F4
MDHKLRVVVRLNIEPASAVIAVSGCVTDANATALLPIIRRTGELIGCPVISVDMSAAWHVDQGALDYLKFLGTGLASDPFNVIVPIPLPACPEPANFLSYDSVA